VFKLTLVVWLYKKIKIKEGGEIIEF